MIEGTPLHEEGRDIGDDGVLEITPEKGALELRTWGPKGRIIKDLTKEPLPDNDPIYDKGFREGDFLAWCMRPKLTLVKNPGSSKNPLEK